MDLKGKKALITGGGRGIGNGCATEIARRGADVVVNDRPGSPDLVKAVEVIAALGNFCEGVEANVFDRAGCEQLVASAIEKLGRIDILVSNPAFSLRQNFLDYDPEMFERTLTGTLAAGFHISQLVARHMVERGGGGKIVFISSVHAGSPYANSVAYNAAKAGLNHMAKTIATELAIHDIHVNIIEPGWIDTPGERETFDPEVIKQREATLPLRRLGTAADIGKAAAFLASDDASYITGTVLCVDGGFRYKECRADDLIPPKE